MSLSDILLCCAAAVAFSVRLEDGCMMNEPVDGGDAHRFIGKDIVPTAEGPVCCDHDRLSLVAGCDEFEEEAGFCLIFLNI